MLPPPKYRNCVQGVVGLNDPLAIHKKNSIKRSGQALENRSPSLFARERVSRAAFGGLCEKRGEGFCVFSCSPTFCGGYDASFVRYFFFFSGHGASLLCYCLACQRSMLKDRGLY